MPTTANTINYYVAADGTLRDGQQGAVAQTPRLNYGTEYSVTLTFPASTIAEGDQLQVALNRTRTFFSSASATGDAPVAAVAKHDVTAEEAAAQAVTLTLSTNTRAMIDQVNGIDHPVRGFFGVHVLRGQSFVTLAVADALMMSLESGPDAISPPLPILDYPTRQEMNDAVEAAQNSASAAKTSEDNADASASAAARDAQAAGQSATNAGNSATLAESYAVGGTGTRLGEDTDNAKYYLEQLGQHETNARASADEAAAWAKGTPQQVAPYGGENSAKGYATAAAGSASSANTSATQAAGSAGAASRDATAAVTARNAAETAQGKAETAQGKAEDAQEVAETAQGKAEDAQEAAETAQEKAEDAQDAAEDARDAAVTAKNAAETAQANAAKIAEGSDADVAPLGLEHSAKGWAQEAAATLASKRDILQTLVTSSSTALVVEAGKSYNWTVSAASTIALATADKVAGKETRIDIYIDLQDGGSVSGDGVTISDAVLQSGWYKLIWDGTNATLYSTKAGGAEAVITIPPSSTTYTLQDNKHYQQVPNAVPTYTLPIATMDGLVHEITVLVDFLHVTSCSFVDAGGVPVTLQSAISPQIGEAYIFRCYWYGKWRVVPLKIRNAATASSSNGVVEVTDAVSGDALALRMAAPRSVVVNQLVQNGNFANGTTNWSRSNSDVVLSVSNSVMTITLDSVNATASVFQDNVSIIKGHTYAVILDVSVPHATTGYLRFYGGTSFAQTDVTLSANTRTKALYLMPNVSSDGYRVRYYLIEGSIAAYSNDDAITLYSFQLVDLTQLCNGDSTKIAAIQTWDDLVAYDPRFASYVEYNTGTVTGVQPQVKVTGKNLANPQVLIDKGAVLQQDGSLYMQTASSYLNTLLFDNTTHKYHGQIAISLDVKYAPYTSRGVCLVVRYTDGTLDTIPDAATNNEDYIHRTLISNSGKTIDKVYCSYGTGSAESWLKNIQIELGSTATPYEPYRSAGVATSPVPLYGVGTAADSYDAVTGKVGHQMASVDMGTLNWTYANAGYWRYEGLSDLKPSPASDVQGNYIADKYTATNSYTVANTSIVNTIGVNNSQPNGYLYVRNGSDSVTPSGLFYYEKITPTTSQSTPTQIFLQAGNNVALQTDGGRTLGELSMTYENLPAAD